MLEPICQSEIGGDRRMGLRLRRLLAVHHHRAGEAEKALALFEAVRALAVSAGDLPEMMFIDCELAELHTMRGRFQEAEAATRRGLELLARQDRRARGADRRPSLVRFRANASGSVRTLPR